ncbi:MAG: hypothetical protein LBD60_01855 [Puniceicoccales bacterium]|nr:hypothetical protein [Puniceicoccales bacterium]
MAKLRGNIKGKATSCKFSELISKKERENYEKHKEEYMRIRDLPQKTEEE